MMLLAHGAVGCGAFAPSFRIDPPGFVQGVESFTSLHLCTNIEPSDLEDSGDAKLERALEEAFALFPLAHGAVVANEDPTTLMGADIHRIVTAKSKRFAKPVIAASQLTSAPGSAAAIAVKTAGKYCTISRSNAHDVAIPFQREASGMVWFVAKLLREIGLDPVLEFTGASASDLARIAGCKLVIGFTPEIDVPLDYMPWSSAQHVRRWFGMPLVWTCFNSPSATDASLRAIAAQFGRRIQRRTEAVIAANRERIDALLAHYRPQFKDRLMVHFQDEPETSLECYRLLGFRIGNRKGWPGKTGVWRTPRMVFDPRDPSDKALRAYVADAKPDFILCDRRDVFEARKFGQATMIFSPFFDQYGNTAWGYDGFACLVAELDRAVGAPWRKLVKPPWPVESG